MALPNLASQEQGRGPFTVPAYGEGKEIQRGRPLSTDCGVGRWHQWGLIPCLEVLGPKKEDGTQVRREVAPT